MVFFAADGELPYEKVVNFMDLVRNNGAENLGIVFDDLRAGPPRHPAPYTTAPRVSFPLPRCDPRGEGDSVFRGFRAAQGPPRMAWRRRPRSWLIGWARSRKRSTGWLRMPSSL